MGEVYRAEDLRLGREVALKLLPPGLEDDPERLARFEREAKVLASLNHPGIAGLYEVGEGRAVRDGEPDAPAGEEAVFLVMELVEGETLAERVARGPVPLEEALRLGLQIARALEAAHDHGVLHRDLKPANLKITPDGRVKVLDFGLAKALAGGAVPGEADLATRSPTLTARGTLAGTILGTAAYMSPEQAKGREADERSDIWSFGVVLAEMLSGQPLFREETVTETLAAVLKEEPRLDRLPPGTPRSLRRLLDRCLRKDPAERLRDIADVRLALEDIAAEATATEAAVAPEHAARPRVLRTAALLAAAAVVGFAAALLLSSPAPAPAPVEPPPRSWVLEHGDLRESRPALSPDGHRVAYSRDGRIWVRDLRRLEALPVAGTEGGTVPFWSPDGEWLGFSTDDGFWRVRPDGSGRTSITTPGIGALAGGAAWLPDGRIIFTTGDGPLLAVDERGGASTTFLALAPDEADFHNVAALPDGRGVLTIAHRGDRLDNIQLVGPDGSRREILSLPGRGISYLAYSPTGHVLFSNWPARHGLWALPFDLEALAPNGEPYPIAAGGTASTAGPGGTLVYSAVLPSVRSELVLVDRSGDVVRRIGEPMTGLYPAPALSPDGARIVAPVASDFDWDLWSFEVDGGAARRLTFLDAPWVGSPAFSPDGREVYFSVWRSTEDFALHRVPVVGGTDPLPVLRGESPPAFTHDGRSMIYNHREGGFNWDLWRRGVDEEGPGTPVATGPGWDLYPAVSPDDRLLSFAHRSEITVVALDGRPGRWQIGRGAVSRWSPDGRRLFYLRGHDLMEVPVTPGPEPRFGPARHLFTFETAPTHDTSWPTFEVMPDGATFLMVRATEPPPGLIAVQSWVEALAH